MKKKASHPYQKNKYNTNNKYPNSYTLEIEAIDINGKKYRSEIHRK